MLFLLALALLLWVVLIVLGFKLLLDLTEL